nr:DUF4149 domain-containing protein [Brevundimonas naejangsanensis]
MARYRSSTDTTARFAGVAFVATLWLGLLIGVSFLATPVKFQAPSLTLATALEVGQATFALFTRVEWGLIVLLALAVVRVGRTSAQLGLWICVGLLALVLAAQSLWLLPILDARVAFIIAGETPPPSEHHWLYVALESSKLLTLAFMSWRSFGRLGRMQRSIR